MNWSSVFELKSLGDIAAKVKFSIVDGPFGTQLHASEYTNEGIPVIRVINTSYDGRFLSDQLVFISAKKALILERSRVAPGDVIVAKTGATIGKSAIFPAELQQGIVASSCMKITVDTTVADHRYVAYLIQSAEGQAKIIDAASGSTRTTINIKPFAAIRFGFPEKCEQSKIADILSTVDQAIEQTEALIAKQQRIKIGLVQDLLTRGIDQQGKLRSEQTHKFKTSPFGRIPEEWQVLTLAQCADRVVVGLASSTTHAYRDTGIALIRNQNIKRGYFDDTQMLFLDSRFAQSFPNKATRQGDVLTVRTGANVGDTAMVPSRYVGCPTFTTLITSPNKEKLVSEYLVSYIESGFGHSELNRILVGGGKENLNVGQFVNLRIVLPPVDEQEAINTRLGVITSQINSEISSRGKLRRLKVALRQDLLTGGKRVTNLLALEPKCEKVYAGQ